MRGQPTSLRCSTCGLEIECCEFCEDPDCKVPTCYDCLNVALGQALPQPHDHGG